MAPLVVIDSESFNPTSNQLKLILLEDFWTLCQPLCVMMQVSSFKTPNPQNRGASAHKNLREGRAQSSIVLTSSSALVASGGSVESGL